MGRKIEGGEKRRKSHSRSIRNIRKFPLFSFFSCGGGGEKNMGAGGGPKKRKL